MRIQSTLVEAGVMFRLAFIKTVNFYLGLFLQLPIHFLFRQKVPVASREEGLKRCLRLGVNSLCVHNCGMF